MRDKMTGAAFVLLALLISACGGESPTDPSLPLAAGKRAAKVSLCHLDDAGLYVTINVSARAVNAHLNHGDEIADGDVLDENCEPINAPPVANAGLDQAATVGIEVALDGSGSTDPDGDDLTYAWSEDSANPATVFGAPANASSASFTPSVSGTYLFGLVVNDGQVDSAIDHVSITVTEDPTAPTPIQWTNGHYYGIVLEQNTWTEANAKAESRTFAGLSGHLATIHSDQENAFILGLAQQTGGVIAVWLGGFQPEGSGEPGGGWRWVTEEPWNYTKWDPPNPNDGGVSGEDYLQMLTGYPYHVGTWADIADDNPDFRPYIVEYE